MACTNEADTVAAERHNLSELVSLRSELLSATARADRKAELLKESQAEAGRITALLKEVFEAQADLTREVCGGIPPAEALRKARQEVQALHAQLVARRSMTRGDATAAEMEEFGLVSRLKDLRAVVPQLQAETQTRAAEADSLRRYAAEGKRRAADAEARAREAEEKYRRVCDASGVVCRAFNSSQVSREAPVSPEAALSGTNAQGVVSRRLSFSPFDVSREVLSDEMDGSPRAIDGSTIDAAPAFSNVVFKSSTAD